VSHYSGSSLHWKFTSTDALKQRDIYNDQGLNPSYANRGVRVQANSNTGEYHLVFAAAELHDAGTYTCQDGDGRGEAHAAWLAVLGQFAYVTFIEIIVF